MCCLFANLVLDRRTQSLQKLPALGAALSPGGRCRDGFPVWWCTGHTLTAHNLLVVGFLKSIFFPLKICWAAHSLAVFLSWELQNQGCRNAAQGQDSPPNTHPTGRPRITFLSPKQLPAVPAPSSPSPPAQRQQSEAQGFPRVPLYSRYF